MVAFSDDFGTTIHPPRRKTQDSQIEKLATLTVISHPNMRRVGDRAILAGLAAGREAGLSRAVPEFKHPEKLTGEPLNDPFMSRSPILITAEKQGGIRLDASATRTRIAIGKNLLEDQACFSAADLETGVILVLADRIVLLLHWTIRGQQIPRERFNLMGYSDPLLHLCHEIKRVSDLETPILLRGLSGTGKELVAQAIHAAGKQGKPFISVNMGAIPPNLAASELFGAIKGSFTGADRNQVGYFKAAQGGTLFLDEIGEATPEVQVLLLRALESGEISPVGSQVPIRIQVRLIAATDADLELRMEEESFKTPLFHRLSGYEIRLPSLRQRLEDLGRLFIHFAHAELAHIRELQRLEQSDPQSEPWLPTDLVLRLLEFSWPGNIRQLRNVVRQLIIGCRGEQVLHTVPRVEELLTRDAPMVVSTGKEASKMTGPRRKPADITEDELVAVLEEHHWDIKASAEALTISRGAIYLMIEKSPQLRKASTLSAEEIQKMIIDHKGDMALVANSLKISPRALSRRVRELGL